MTDFDILRKKLLYRSTKRGWKENDLLLGKFAQKNVNSMTEEELLSYKELLKEPDVDIYAWVNGKNIFPSRFSETLAKKLLQFDYSEV